MQYMNLPVTVSSTIAEDLESILWCLWGPSDVSIVKQRTVDALANYRLLNTNGWYRREVNNTANIGIDYNNESTAGADASVKVQRHDSSY